MYAKLIAITLFGLAIGASVLLMRQERLRLANQTAATHQQIDRTRQDVWAEQTRAASGIDPHHLHERVEARQLALESPVIEHERDAMRTRYAERDDTPRFD